MVSRLRALAPGAAPCGLPPELFPRVRQEQGRWKREAASVGCPGPARGCPRWAAAAEEGRSRQELMQRGPIQRRRRGAGGPRPAGPRPAGGGRRRPVRRSAPRWASAGLSGPGAGGGVEPPAEPQRLAALPALPALAGAQRGTAPPRGRTAAAARRVAAAARDAAGQRERLRPRARRAAGRRPPRRPPRRAQAGHRYGRPAHRGGPAAARGCPRAGET